MYLIRVFFDISMWQLSYDRFEIAEKFAHVHHQMALKTLDNQSQRHLYYGANLDIIFSIDYTIILNKIMYISLKDWGNFINKL